MNKFARFSGTPDANEKEIISELERRGAMVIVIDRPVDLVVGYLGVWVFVEIKNGPRARLRKSQKSFLQQATAQGLPVLVMTDLDDCDTFFPEIAETAPVRSHLLDVL